MRPARSHRVGNLFRHATILEQKADDGGGKQEQGPGKNDWHHSCVIHFQRHVGRLSAVHFSADHTLCILHRNFPNSLRNGDDCRDYQKQESHHQDENRWVNLALTGPRPCWHKCFPRLRQRRRQARHDPDRNYQGNTIADPPFGDLIAQPHQKKCASGKRNDRYNPEGPTLIIHQRYSQSSNRVWDSTQNGVVRLRMLKGNGQ